MQRVLHPTVILSVLLLPFASCTVPGTYVAPDPATEVHAVVNCETSSVFAVLDPLNSREDLWMIRVDEDTLTKSGWDGYPERILVRPGLHVIVLRVRQTIPSGAWKEFECVVEGEFAAGLTYWIRWRPVEGNPMPIVVEAGDADAGEPVTLERFKVTLQKPHASGW